MFSGRTFPAARSGITPTSKGVWREWSPPRRLQACGTLRGRCCLSARGRLTTGGGPGGAWTGPHPAPTPGGHAFVINPGKLRRLRLKRGEAFGLKGEPGWRMGMGGAAARHLACRHDLPHGAIVSHLGWLSGTTREPRGRRCQNIRPHADQCMQCTRRTGERCG
jgi:hypothetical protein